MAESLLDYHNAIFWINFSVYWLYFLIKYMGAVPLWVVLEIADKNSKYPPCCYKCKQNNFKLPPCFHKFARIVLYCMRRPVLLLFGKQLAIKRYNDGQDKIFTLSLRNRRLSYGATMVLFVITATVVLLAVGSALNLTLFSITHVCTEDPKIDCYPQLIEGADDTGLNINITAPIQDCSFWNSKDVANRVTFECYQLVFNAEWFFAAMGGLLAFSIIMMKVLTELFLCLGKCTQSYETHRQHCKVITVTFVIRILLATAAAVVEVTFAILGLVFGATGSTVDNTDDTPELTFLAMHTAELLLLFGAVATLLWLPWETYHKIKVDRGSNPKELVTPIGGNNEDKDNGD